jgi:hypothetical protein
LTAPASVCRRNRKVKPVISRGNSHGMMISDRATLRSGKRRLNRRARPNPMTNWNSNDRNVNVNVRTIALWVVAWTSVAL